MIAPDSFKGSIGAADAARALAAGWSAVRPRDELVLLPMADGGEGTVDVLAAAVPQVSRRRVRVEGPDGQAAEAEWLLLPDGTAVVELASASGIGLLTDGLRPLDAHTAGFGQAISAALDARATRLLLAIGGSASTDGGAGVLTALGAALLDADDRPIPRGGRGLAHLARVDLAGLRPLPPGGAVILSDVTNPLLGSTGAAAVFGPQKGATPADVAELERGLARLARLLQVDPATAGSGAAGGTAVALLAWGAMVQSGAATVAEALGLPRELRSADAVITGEGRFDAQTGAGKVAHHVLHLGREAGVPVLLAAGALAAAPNGYAAAVALTDLAGSAERSLAEPRRWLEQAGRHLASADR